MTERKPAGMSYESWIDRQIREAQERGEFDDLPGAGKPLENLGKPHGEMWWIKDKLEREGLSTEAVLPTPILLRKEIDRLAETVRDLRSEQDVRDVVAELNERIAEYVRTPSSGPQIPVGRVDADDVVEQWRAQRPAPPAQPPADPLPEPAPPSRRLRWWRRKR
ncbi:DUF1992 domain-containing protein [Phytoactinopolyspora alkaliphila]|uniref:DUF1992 domain-containing protein n=1 Tax=Phytoactinopolyspora alkaliphila TaxID=1783498 RepID=A0A6N9YRK0_9ACTN|nr:DUF1992 domain-containing protein [Phytoactinopolyspora alkaliphila]NED97429.1 DUF1992 domain-containing protein [Phytoactinopolyspora alkaliphila]